MLLKKNLTVKKKVFKIKKKFLKLTKKIKKKILKKAVSKLRAQIPIVLQAQVKEKSVLLMRGVLKAKD